MPDVKPVTASAADYPTMADCAAKFVGERGRPDGNSLYYYNLWMNARTENENLRKLVGRLTDNLENFVRESADPGTEALAAIHCGRNFVYG